MSCHQNQLKSAHTRTHYIIGHDYDNEDKKEKKISTLIINCWLIDQNDYHHHQHFDQKKTRKKNKKLIPKHTEMKF